MIEKRVKIKKLASNDFDDIHYWLKKTPEERISCIEVLRCDYWGKDYANKSRFPRIYKIIKHK